MTKQEIKEDLLRELNKHLLDNSVSPLFDWQAYKAMEQQTLNYFLIDKLADLQLQIQELRDFIGYSLPPKSE